MSITGTPWDFLLLGLTVLAATGYGYLEGFRSGFLKGVRAAERKREGAR